MVLPQSTYSQTVTSKTRQQMAFFYKARVGSKKNPVPLLRVLDRLCCTCRASMKALVPDLAMVPRLLMRSALVMPIPVSTRVRVRSCWLGMMSIFRSFPLSSLDGSVRLSYLILSRAYNLREKHGVKTSNSKATQRC